MRGHAAACDDTVIVNTCAVTAEAERQARQAIRRAARERPGARIVVTGCAAQIDPARWAALPGVHRVLGNTEKLLAESWADGAPSAVSDIMAARETAGHLVTAFAGRARAFVQVQQGCDHRCTFCIIPFGRGPSRSVPIGALVAQVRALVVEGGFQEVVLTGVDITSYGRDLPGAPSLGQMARRLLALVPELKRLRLSSLDPHEIDAELWALIAGEERLMPHLHLSIQSGSDLVLKRMKRRHSRAEALAVIARARALRPGVAIGADLIAGFPTETEVLFAETLALVDEAALPYLHVFPFSERPGTPAARMPPVEKSERRARAARLREAGARHAARYHAGKLGQVVEVLAETATSGHSAHFAPVRLTAPATVGRVVSARVVAADADGAGGGGGLMAIGGFFSRLKEGLTRSTQKLTTGVTAVLTRKRLDEAALEELEEVLIAADFGTASAARVIAAFRRTRFGRDVTEPEIKEALAEEISAILAPVARPLKLDPTLKPHVVLVVGVNGTGKTTTIGKLAQAWRDQGLVSVLVAGDTFRAAAVEQLQIWGERTGAAVISGPANTDPAGLAFEGLTKARAARADVLLIDTAGRLHNKAALMEELRKIIRVLRKQDPTAPHSVLLVLDATTGQNAIEQVRVFKELVDVTGLVVTKLDGSAKGGIVIALAESFGLPIHAVGVGERVGDLRDFSAEDFARGLVDAAR